jgi:hypothetical protein
VTQTWWAPKSSEVPSSFFFRVPTELRYTGADIDVNGRAVSFEEQSAPQAGRSTGVGHAQVLHWP